MDFRVITDFSTLVSTCSSTAFASFTVVGYMSAFAIFLIGYNVAAKKFKKKIDEARSFVEERKKDITRLERNIAGLQDALDMERTETRNWKGKAVSLKKAIKKLQQKEKKPEPPTSELTLFDHLQDESREN